MATGVMNEVRQILHETTGGLYPVVLTPPIEQTPPSQDWDQLKGPISPRTLDDLALEHGWHRDAPVDDFWTLNRKGVWVRQPSSDGDEFDTGIIHLGEPVPVSKEQPLAIRQRILRALAMRVEALHTNIYTGEKADVLDVARFMGHSLVFKTVSGLLSTRDKSPRTV